MRKLIRSAGAPRSVAVKSIPDIGSGETHRPKPRPEYASLPPGQIVPALADQGLYIGSESSFYRVLHQAGKCHPAADWPGCRRNRAPCRVCGPMAQTRFRAGTSAFCRPRCRVCSSTSIWWSTFGAAKWWPGMWPRTNRPRSQRIWCSGPVSRSATTAPAALAAASASSRL